MIKKNFRLLIIPSVTATPLQSAHSEYDCSTSHFGAVNINSRVEEKISRYKNSWLPKGMPLSLSPPVAD